MGIWTAVAETRSGGIDEAGVARMQACPAVAELLHRARAKVLNESIGFVEQALEGVTAVGGFEIERDRLLAAVDRSEISRFAVFERAVLARVIAVPRRFDLDHARAELGEQQRAIRARQDAGKIDDRDAGKRPALRHVRHPVAAEWPSIAQS